MSTNKLTRRNALLGLGSAGFGTASLTTQASAVADTQAKPLAGKVAIVTGARNNMGRAFSLGLGAMGADVVVHYHREATR